MKNAVFLFMAAIPVVTLPAVADALCEEVEFTKSLTNETDWVYSASYTKFSDENGLYISSKEGTAVVSPEFPFSVTSLTITVRHSSNTPQRQLYVFPVVDGVAVDDETLCREITPTNGENEVEVSCSWDREDEVRSIGFKITGKQGNVYLVSARILGSAVAEPPADVAATKIGGTKVTIKWENSANTHSNKVYVYKVVQREERFEMVANYTFDEFSNGGGTDDRTDDFIEAYPDFANSKEIHLPTNSIGQIQISSRDNKGVLIHKGFDDNQNLSAAITLKRYHVADVSKEDRDEMTIGYEESPGTTNIIATVSLGIDFKREIVPLDAFPSGVPIIFNADGYKTYHRVIIDNLAFIRNYFPAGEYLELAAPRLSVIDGGVRISSLDSATEYVVKVTSFTRDGHESDPSAELRITTGAESDNGFTVNIR